MTITIKAPLEISPRLLPGIRIGGGWVQLGYAPNPTQRKAQSLAGLNDSAQDHRQYYGYTIDLPDGREFTGSDLSTGCQHGLQHALASLLEFLSACGESMNYAQRQGIEPSETENA